MVTDEFYFINTFASQDPRFTRPTLRKKILYKMPSILAVLFFLASCALALPPIAHHTSSPEPVPTGARPNCFKPFDRHKVSNVIGICSNLIENFVESFGDQMNTSVRWTGNNSESGHPGTVHLPQVIREINHNRTEACLMEVVDHGNGDSYAASSLMDHGRSILSECFTQDDCGEIALPPHYTTALAVCGTYDSRTRRRPSPTTKLQRGSPFVDWLGEPTVSRDLGSRN